jgi:hypothetical protein
MGRQPVASNSGKIFKGQEKDTVTIPHAHRRGTFTRTRAYGEAQHCPSTASLLLVSNILWVPCIYHILLEGRSLVKSTSMAQTEQEREGKDGSHGANRELLGQV